MRDELNQTMKTIFLASILLTASVAAHAQEINLSPSLTTQPAQPSMEERLKSLVIMHSLKPVVYEAPAMSARMLLTAISGGRVRFAVQSDSQGNPTDWIILAYTHRDLADSTLRVIDKWKFEPVKFLSLPVSAQTEFDVEFRGPDIVSISTVMDQADFVFRSIGIDRFEYKTCRMSELDRIPLLLNVVKPVYSVAAQEHGVRGVVEVQFYIDEKGEVRLPAVVSADRIDLAEAAFEAVKQWKFESPTRNGQPVLISAIQHFDFGTGSTTTTVN